MILQHIQTKRQVESEVENSLFACGLNIVAAVVQGLPVSLVLTVLLSR